jgi:UDP-N-acetylmuramate-alanine ligase
MAVMALPVINIDDFAGKKLAVEFSDRLKVITFGFSADADFRASEVRPSIRGQVFALEARGKSFLSGFLLSGVLMF